MGIPIRACRYRHARIGTFRLQQPGSPVAIRRLAMAAHRSLTSTPPPGNPPRRRTSPSPRTVSETGCPAIHGGNGAVRISPPRPGSPRINAGRRGDTRISALDRHWLRIRERMNLPGVRIHDLRPSFAFRALALGEGHPMIGSLPGHRKEAPTMVILRESQMKCWA